jgi:hypothetical protein
METIDGKPIKILYADDDADDCEFFHAALKEAHANAELTTFEDGKKLLRSIIHQEACFILISDHSSIS